jgi:hypothetical protein
MNFIYRMNFQGLNDGSEWLLNGTQVCVCSIDDDSVSSKCCFFTFTQVRMEDEDVNHFKGNFN